MKKTRDLIIEGNVRIRALLRDALSEYKNLEIAGSVAQGDLAMKKIPETHPDLVFLDVNLPEDDSLETLERIRQCDSDLPVVMLVTWTGTATGGVTLGCWL